MAIESVIHTSREAGVTTITITRPEVRNALNVAVLAGMADAVEAAGSDGETRVIVLTGGAETFSVGADIDMLSGQTAASYVHSPNRFGFERIRETRLPVIAAVSGFCLGGGCEIALAADIVIASDTAIFGQPEINLGIIPGAGGTQLWAERAGRGAQAEAAMGGRFIKAYTARRIGLVDRIVPKEALLSYVAAEAVQLSCQAPLAVRAVKSAMRARWCMSAGAALDHEVTLMANLLASSDAREGIDAFLGKRKATFTGT
ncbi:enoyl-CoA hydratase-related protein [Roseovarius sp. MBR-6]|jgi:enoyl-CoA hydratase/carnithine racemase|uniref:enoyl-CoA hydratase/isomerase family protein n=1 Tax=Roseovarius sp. MBR-6 TaxID=3156459 RepID=UPI00339081B7